MVNSDLEVIDIFIPVSFHSAANVGFESHVPLDVLSPHLGSIDEELGLLVVPAIEFPELELDDESVVDWERAEGLGDLGTLSEDAVASEELDTSTACCDVLTGCVLDVPSFCALGNLVLGPCAGDQLPVLAGVESALSADCAVLGARLDEDVEVSDTPRLIRSTLVQGGGQCDLESGLVVLHHLVDFDYLLLPIRRTVSALVLSVLGMLRLDIEHLVSVHVHQELFVVPGVDLVKGELDSHQEVRGRVQEESG